jgi:protoporphyrin/coproporphyrin ferrochelatase
MNNKAVLLVNLGSPDSPAVPDVRRYLRQFLMDPRVLDAPWPVRFFVVHACILPSRPRQSAEAYRQIWQPDGSPLVSTSRKLQAALQTQIPVPVELAMRYQNPSIDSAIRTLASRNIDQLLLIPLFPHYAMSSFETAVEAVRSAVRRLAPRIRLTVQAPYYERPDYIHALVQSAASHLDQEYDHLLFSFHGIPERHLRISDPTRQHCLQTPDCCQLDSPALATCYRAQCFRTVQAFLRHGHVPSSSVSFQSRLGRDPWLQPYTDQELVRLARTGVRRLRVICPAFVSDCLETIEEIGMRGRETFLEAGGTDYALIPCLNTHPLWIRSLQGMIEEFLGISSVDISQRPGYTQPRT